MPQTDSDFEARFSRLQDELYILLDQAPSAAIARADAVSELEFGAKNVAMLRATIYIEAGGLLGDIDLVTRGVALLEQLIDQAPDNALLKYNCANGLTTMADLVTYEDRGWYLITGELRHKAKQLHQACIEADSNEDIKARANTNLGNALLKAFRFVEAYDCYSRALEFDPTNVVAAAGAARVLMFYAGKGIGEVEILLAAANGHLESARKNPERFRQLAGARAHEELSGLLEHSFPGLKRFDSERATAYQRFVHKHRLALVPTIEGLDLSLKRWDSLTLPGIHQPTKSDYSIPPIFATFNLLKSEFLAVRHLAYTALHAPPEESGSYADTLDYACYGVETALLTLAQRTCVDILDKLAVALLHYLGDRTSAHKAEFRNIFFEKDGDSKDWTRRIRDEIHQLNCGVLALAEMADDIERTGFLHRKRKLRNAATHRFVVLHDISMASATDVNIIERYELETYQKHLIETLQLVRAALIYFVEAVSDREKRTPSELSWPMDVPDHDKIRGRD